MNGFWRFAVLLVWGACACASSSPSSPRTGALSSSEQHTLAIYPTTSRLVWEALEEALVGVDGPDCDAIRARRRELGDLERRVCDLALRDREAARLCDHAHRRYASATERARHHCFEF